MHSASLFNNWQWKEPYSDYNMIFAANTTLSGLVQKKKLGLHTFLKYINYFAFVL